VRAERAVLLAGDFWPGVPVVAVLDRVQADQSSHSYAQDWHFNKELAYSGDGSRVAPLVLASGTDRLHIWLPDGSSSLAVTSYASADQGTSWLARASKIGVAADFATLLVPTADLTPALEQTTLGGREAYRLTVPGRSGSIYLVPNPGGSTYSVGRWTTDAPIALWGFDASGAWSSAVLGGHSQLLDSGRPVATGVRSTILRRSCADVIAVSSIDNRGQDTIALPAVP